MGWLFGRVGLGAVLVSLCAAGAAHAEFPGLDGEQAYESYSYADTEGGPPFTASDSLVTRARTIAACTNAADQSVRQPSCDFGAPSYSPDGAMIVVSRSAPSSLAFGGYAPGASQLMLIGADGSNPQLLPPLTADDEQPAFLRSGRALVFAGRASAKDTFSLYTVNIDGSGLRRLTSLGGSEPAPCANGSIAYIRGSHLYLLSRLGSSRRLTAGDASAPSCAPNSKTIAFLRTGELYVVGSDGRGLRLVTKAAGYGPKGEPNSGSGAFADSFSPDGRQIEMLVSYDVLSGNGSEDALVSVSLQGHASGRKLVVGDSSFSGDSGQSNIDSEVGLAWQPLPGARPG